MRVLVTGGTGFVGRALIRALDAESYEVIAPVRSAEAPDIGGVACLPDFDFASSDSLSRALEGVRAVIHCAAHAHRTGRITDLDRQQFDAVNVDLTLRLFGAANEAGVEQFIFISSVGALRVASNAPVTEETPPAPSGDYAKSKLRAEQRLLSEASAGGTALTILRPCLVYGPGNPGNMSRLSRLLDTGLPLPFGRIDGTRSLIYIDNLTSAILTCLLNEKAYANDFMLCDDEAPSLPELVAAIAAAKGREARLFPLPLHMLRALGRMGDWFARLPGGGVGIDSYSVSRLTNSLPCSNQKIRSMLGWEPPFCLAQGIERTFNA